MRRRITARELAAFGLLCLLIVSCARAITPADISKYEQQEDIEKLIAALQSKDRNVARLAAEALGRIDDPRAVEGLIGSLRIGTPDVAITAARALGRRRDPRAVEPLIFLLKEKHRNRLEYRAAAWALGELGDGRAVIILITDIVVPYTRGGGESAVALGKIKDPRAVQPLIIALQYQDDRRRASAWALREITGKDFGEDLSQWEIWWEQNKESFSKNR